jgi:hypothetical protein
LLGRQEVEVEELVEDGALAVASQKAGGHAGAQAVPVV